MRTYQRAIDLGDEFFARHHAGAAIRDPLGMAHFHLGMDIRKQGLEDEGGRALSRCGRTLRPGVGSRTQQYLLPAASRMAAAYLPLTPDFALLLGRLSKRSALSSRPRRKVGTGLLSAREYARSSPRHSPLSELAIWPRLAPRRNFQFSAARAATPMSGSSWPSSTSERATVGRPARVRTGRRVDQVEPLRRY